MLKSSLIALVPLLASLALGAAETKPTPQPAQGGAGLSSDQQKFWDDAKANQPTSPDAIAAEALYIAARAHYQAARFVEARDQVEEALRRYPPHREASALREDILGILALRDNRLKQATTWLADIQDVKTQETAVRMAAKLELGDKKMAAGDFAGAELAYDSVDIALRTFPYQFDWGNLPEQIATKKVEARAQDRRQQLDRTRQDRDRAQDIANQKRALEEEALRAKVDEMLRRARVAFERKDFKRAEVDAWNAYELDRRREDARELYLSSRRKGHQQFDATYREARLEGLTRVHEEIHKALIPQSELLVYPEDWQRRALRQPPQLGTNNDEAWVGDIRNRMDQVISFEFEDAAFEDVIAFFRQVTGLNIIVAPEVFAKGAGTITFKARDMRFKEAMKWVLEMAKLHMAIQNQAIFVSAEPVAGSVQLRMYDIADLVSPVRDLPGRELAYNTGGGGGGGGFDIFKGADVAEDTATDPSLLVEFIKTNVAPDQWERDGVAIENRDRTLFVSQSPEVHDLIVALLNEQRNQSKLQVNVNVRLLDVRKGFFEEIGFEYHDVPVGIIDASSASGFQHRTQDSDQTATVRQILPGNQSQAAPTGHFGGQGAYTRGLMVDGSFNVGSFLNTDQVNLIFAAAEEESDAQILQHPSITCFNNQRAHATFMNQYAYIADYEIVSSNLDPVIQVLTYGDILDVRPVVSSDRKYITMEIRPSSVILVGVFVEIIFAQRVVTVAGGAVVFPPVPYPIELPNVQVRTLRSTVMLPDKGSLLIGGFTRSLRERTHSGIPFLSHIPFLGRLFSRNGLYDENRRLFFLLNAEILDLGEREALY